MPTLPLLTSLRGYRPEWLRHDILSGLAVAAVALPIAIAYPALAGLPPQVGLYSSMLAVLGYAAFGSSRQLIVGPDAGTIVMLAAVFMSLGLTTPEERIVVSAAMAVVVGAMCIVASVLRLGFIANFLSRPILSGYMTGISLSILVGQIGRFTGVKIESEGLFRPLFELATKAGQIHWPSLSLGVAMLILLRVLGAWLPSVPGPLVVVVLATALSSVFDFPAMGIGVAGEIPSQLPVLALPFQPHISVAQLFLSSAAVLIVSFGSGIITARSFGAKNKYPVDANRELVGFGAANIATGLFGGFPVTGADSRTAVNDLMGGKTQLAGIVSAAALAIAILFFADALALLPTPALGAILVSAALGLIDLWTLRDLWRLSRIELVFALISIAGVVVLGVLNGVVIAIGATLLYLLTKGLSPRDAMLGRIPGRHGFYKLHRYPEAQPIPGVIIYLLQGSLLFFNVDHVKGRLREIIDGMPANAEWLLYDASSTPHIDSTAVVMLGDICDLADERGLKFGIVEMHSEPLDTLVRAGIADRLGTEMIFDDLEDAAAAFRERHKAPAG